MRNNKIRIALTKGRLEKEALGLFGEMGWDVSAFSDKGRRLIFTLPGAQIVLAKAPDVITYVEHGVCDLGITGKDMIMEYGGRYFEVADFGFGRCKFALASKKGERENFFEGCEIKTVASKYPNVTRRFFESKGMDVDIVKIEGSVELAPLLGLADGIVDLVETGATLKENGLEIREEIADISARLIVNTVSMKMKKPEIDGFLRLVESKTQEKVK
ncbi:MAG: ATP phosphoribosyltransferase [Oscillospiraceae bacterium]|jgi:ATP phosphoribosyltransferase|nr:ATP phosphoribosyltransferase [Oscillospiraceae bacterium]